MNDKELAELNKKIDEYDDSEIQDDEVSAVDLRYGSVSYITR